MPILVNIIYHNFDVHNVKLYRNYSNTKCIYKTQHLNIFKINRNKLTKWKKVEHTTKLTNVQTAKADGKQFYTSYYFKGTYNASAFPMQM